MLLCDTVLTLTMVLVDTAWTHLGRWSPVYVLESLAGEYFVLPCLAATWSLIGPYQDNGPACCITKIACSPSCLPRASGVLINPLDHYSLTKRYNCLWGFC